MSKKEIKPTSSTESGEPRHHPGDDCTQPPADFTEAQRALWWAAHRESQPPSAAMVDAWYDQMHRP